MLWAACCSTVPWPPGAVLVSWERSLRQPCYTLVAILKPAFQSIVTTNSTPQENTYGQYRYTLAEIPLVNSHGEGKKSHCVCVTKKHVQSNVNQTKRKKTKLIIRIHFSWYWSNVAASPVGFNTVNASQLLYTPMYVFWGIQIIY